MDSKGIVITMTCVAAKMEGKSTLATFTEGPASNQFTMAFQTEQLPWAFAVGEGYVMILMPRLTHDHRLEAGMILT